MHSHSFARNVSIRNGPSLSPVDKVSLSLSSLKTLTLTVPHSHSKTQTKIDKLLSFRKKAKFREKRRAELGVREETDVETDRELEVGPQFSLKEQLEKDKDDESLRRWKEQLLGSVDYAAVGETLEPQVEILSLTILSPGQPELVLPIPFEPNAKGYAFCLKDGSLYHLKFSFKVSNNIVSGLKYTNTVWKTGVRVENTKVMLGTFSPQQEPYTYELAEERTPSGMFARGSYSAKTKFVDDDGKCYLDISYSFEIRKEWPTQT
ncbi:hypothetical protein C5167_040202 [Papaver somniferum]|uniref:Rho GDP-dissociation inhibitor 1 n=1 Tax=Papaver somniferum TaxID=3469 RepID=A0A4Y7IIH9_PAPSO|nr:hypothetical protein C5167_040202 [Papaver somniferum]